MQKKNILASTFIFFVGFIALAQGVDVPPPAPPPPPGLPIDGGIVLLFSLALGYGIYKSLKTPKRPV
ncbi:PID-CTERM protein-sorting domain-containing protein [Winogradskyella wichelsiae]|uniref:PID-CTERM protein-sorting domain-containing protein n=1 Tax=Winogradskyella wichelsiae TaxID=2697007 RepID=UPI0015C76E75|nr:hypothetical protein [Winogradskyella wichelsiae]